jgi:hypothetical protein
MDELELLSYFTWLINTRRVLYCLSTYSAMFDTEIQMKTRNNEQEHVES